MAKSLLPLGGFRCVGTAARPHPDAMLFQMRQLEAHCRALRTRRFARPGAGRHDVFLLDYLPPAGPGQQPLRPFQRLPHRRGLHDRHGAGGGGAARGAPSPRVALCARHRAPPCAACVQPGSEHRCRRTHEGHRTDAAQGRVGARALRACLQPTQPAEAGSVAASQAARGSPSARQRPRSQSSSSARETRRARCPLHDLHAGALCLSHRVCMGRRGCPTLFLPARCALFCGGDCPVTAPEGGAFPARAADVAATAPPEPYPAGRGFVDFSCPPPPCRGSRYPWGAACAQPRGQDPRPGHRQLAGNVPKNVRRPLGGGGGR